MTLLYSEMNSTDTRKTQNENIFDDHLCNRAILFHSPDTMLLLTLKRNTPSFLKKCILLASPCLPKLGTKYST